MTHPRRRRSDGLDQQLESPPPNQWWVFQLFGDDDGLDVYDIALVEASTSDEAMAQGFRVLELRNLSGHAPSLAAKVWMLEYPDAFFTVKPLDIQYILDIIFHTESLTSNLDIKQAHSLVDFLAHEFASRLQRRANV